MQKCRDVAQDANIKLSKECWAFLKLCLVRDPKGRATAQELRHSDFVKKASPDAWKKAVRQVPRGKREQPRSAVHPVYLSRIWKMLADRCTPSLNAAMVLVATIIKMKKANCKQSSMSTLILSVDRGLDAPKAAK